MAAIRTSSRRDVFVGRGEELTRLSRFLEDDARRVLFMHGLAGSGKSHLLRRSRERSATDARVIILDCRAVEPTEQGFIGAVARETGQVADRLDHLRPALTPLGALARRVVLCLDQYEVFRLLDTWLRQVVVPSLPTTVSLLIAGREEPHPAWHGLPAGDFEAMLLGPLAPNASTDLVRSMGVLEEEAPAITRFAGGHPLTLVLGALAAKERPGRPVREVTMTRLLEEFTRAYLQDLDREIQGLLEAAAVVRRVNRPLLAAMLPDIDPWKGFETLRELPFVDVTSDGLAVHEALQQAIAAQLRATDPGRHRSLRRRAWRHLREELRMVSKTELWRYTADMIYLLESPTIREALFPSGAHEFAIEMATPADAAVIDAIIDRHEPPEAAELLRSWWSRCPDAFRVARDGQGEVAGFSIITTSGRTDPKRLSYDPVVGMWLAHMRKNPIPPSQEALLIRRWLTWEAGDKPSPAQASMWLDLKRIYMGLRPHLRRNYAVTEHPEIYGPVMDQLGGGVIPHGKVDIAGREYHGLFLEFGPSSVDGWLTRLAAQELGIAEEDELFDVRQRQITINGHRVDLTPKEFEVMHYLRERTGTAVTRMELLGAIWGYGDEVGSNVVDAVIHGLRKKLGAKADTIQTVRGVGYRLSP